MAISVELLSVIELFTFDTISLNCRCNEMARNEETPVSGQFHSGVKWPGTR